MNVKVTKFVTSLLPRKYLCHYPLKLGALATGIFMSCIMFASSIALAIQVLNMENCTVCASYPLRSVYSFSITAVVYTIMMLFINLWFIWGVKKMKSSVVLSWIVITAMWMVQTSCLLIVMLIMYSTEAKFVPWLLTLIFAVAAIGILLYCILVVYAFWLELKRSAVKNKDPALIIGKDNK